MSQGGPQRVAYNVSGQTFLVDSSYELSKELGQGAYGCVIAATHKQTGESLAIKRLNGVFLKKILTKRALREIKLLRHFRRHKNITCLYDLDIIDPENFNEVYLYEELMEADLHAIIRSGQPLSDAHFQSFIYQTLCGLRYIHSASVLHRDLKPGNLLVNADCELKICDFGLARGFETDPAMNQAGSFMTEYVTTRWYRAPEIMLSYQNYTTAIDIWSVGCILAELLGRRPLFKGRDYVDQLNQILHVLGTPSEETLRRVGSPRAQEYIRSLPYKPRIPFEKLFPDANPDALDLLARMLAFDPAERISCEDALKHPYLAVWHDPADEPVCPEKFDFGFEAVNDVPGMKNLILEEVRTFRAEVRAQFHADLHAQQLQAQQQQQQQQAAQQQQLLQQQQQQQQQQAIAAHAQRSGLYQPRRQESLPIPTRDEIRKSSPQEDHSNVLLGASNSLVHQQPQDAGSVDHQLTDAEMLEDPNVLFERELAGHR